MGYTDLDSIFRGSTGAIVPASWTDQVNDNIKFLYQLGPQVGSAVVTTDSSGNATITFPLAFAAAPTVIVSNGDTSVTTFTVGVAALSVTTTSFQIHTSLTSTTIRINYVAK